MLRCVYALALGCLSATLLLACGVPRVQGTTSSPFPAWTRLQPPTTDPISAYAFSLDTPGLMLACAGSKLD
jgi:hypothetical protein